MKIMSWNMVSVYFLLDTELDNIISISLLAKMH